MPKEVYKNNNDYCPVHPDKLAIKWAWNTDSYKFKILNKYNIIKVAIMWQNIPLPLNKNLSLYYKWVIFSSILQNSD